MADRSPVFEETYHHYLRKITALDLETVAGRIGGQFEGEHISIDLFSRTYQVSGRGITDTAGEKPSIDKCVILSKYVILSPEAPPTRSEWVNYRDLKDSGPLTTYFPNEVERKIATEFTGGKAALEKAGSALGGFAPEMDASYDVALQFDALPKLPLVMLFNDADDEFPATCSVLFERRAEDYLDAECLAMLGALLAAQLVKNK